MSLIVGIDEAGRGPVVGPLVIAGVGFHPNKIKLLKFLGVRDSKTLTPLRRRKLYKVLYNIASHIVVEVIDPWDIDKAVRRRSFNGLNELEAYYVAKVIKGFTNVKKVFVDSPDVKVERYREKVLRFLNREVEIVCANYADKIFPVVSAASIIAKVRRDLVIEKLSKIYGVIGSGYPTDPLTLKSLPYLVKHAPQALRFSWKTLQKFS